MKKYLLLLLLVMGCSAIKDYKDPYEDSEGATGPFILDQLSTGDQLPGGHITGDKPVEEVRMLPEDRQFLEEQCGGCHDLNRVFATRGRRELWEKLLAQKQHQEAGFTEETQEKLYKIFQQYLGN